MFDNIDSFVKLSRENTSIKELELYPFDGAPGKYELREKVGQIVGNLMELKLISINFIPYSIDDTDDGGNDVRRLDWETVSRILPHVRRKVAFSSEDYDAEVGDIQGLARAIHGHPMISAFDCHSEKLNFANMGPWCAASATLPYLERIVFGLQEPETDEQLVLLLNLEPLKELLRSPALRVVRFDGVSFTNELCRATANALEEDRDRYIHGDRVPILTYLLVPENESELYHKQARNLAVD
jgi:hypothetical protein